MLTCLSVQYALTVLKIPVILNIVWKLNWLRHFLASFWLIGSLSHTIVSERLLYITMIVVLIDAVDDTVEPHYLVLLNSSTKILIGRISYLFDYYDWLLYAPFNLKPLNKIQHVIEETSFELWQEKPLKFIIYFFNTFFFGLSKRTNFNKK